VTDLAVSPRRKARSPVLAVALGAHVVHDGFTDQLYVLLPVWRSEFALSYAAIGAIRALYAGATAGLQVPSARLAERLGPRVLLAGGTALVGLGLVLAGATGTLWGLVAALALCGCGSSVQHPIASNLVARASGPGGPAYRRVALGAYNFAGDLGKVATPAAMAWLLVVLPWRTALPLAGAAGIAAAAAIWLALGAALARERLPEQVPADQLLGSPSRPPPRRSGFPTLVAIAVVDSATRMGLLTFLPFVIAAKGGTTASTGLALSLLFAGGAAGKLACGWLGARMGVIPTVWLTEALTAAGVLALPWLPLGAVLALLPALGIALNGTSSVLYGTVPELVPPARQQRAFGLFYTATIGSGALAPALYGLLGDAVGFGIMMGALAGMVLLTLPLGLLLRPALLEGAGNGVP
jgi:MFS transporter, FSR family, fosmidomycin resistance protein